MGRVMGRSEVIHLDEKRPYLRSDPFLCGAQVPTQATDLLCLPETLPVGFPQVNDSPRLVCADRTARNQTLLGVFPQASRKRLLLSLKPDTRSRVATSRAE
jgi:hypothetical protein